MSTLRVLALLAITVSSAQAAALAEERSPARLPVLGSIVAAALAQPPTDHADTAPASCPYHFGSNMPPDTFCVYRGVAFGSGGEVCATDAVVIWSSFGSQPRVRVGPAEKAPGMDREVYLGIVADPELVLRAIVDSRQGDRAEVVGYTVGSEEAPQPLAGTTTLQVVRRGSSATAEVLRMELREPRRFRPGSCAFASCSGAFLGVVRSPSETTRYIDTLLAPKP
jgi:hypothetical protein